MKTLIKSVLLASVFLCAQTSFAEGGYLILGLGQASVDAEEDGVTLEGEDTSLQLGVGFRPSENAAFEFGYMDLGEATDTITVFPGFSFDVSTAADGMFMDVKFGSSSESKVGLFGKMGLFMWDAEGCVEDDCITDDGSDIFFGAGIAFQAGKGSFNLEMLKLSLDDVDVDNIGLAFNLPFGK